MLRFRGPLAILIPGLILGTLVAGSAFAADSKSATQVFATVDFAKAFEGYEKKQQLAQQFDSQVLQANKRLELRNANKLLTVDEFNQYADLSVKAVPTDADKKKIDEFASLSKQREQEFQSLQQKPSPTDADKTRLTELQDTIKKADAQIKDDTDKYKNDLGKQQEDLSKKLIDDVNTAVSAVAKEKGITIVFNKSGDPGLVVFSSFDITDDVLKKLNKK